MSLVEFPQVQALKVSWQRLLKAQRVLVAVTDQSLICCWMRAGQWVWRSGVLPPDCCRDGVPLLPELIGDFLGELLLDCDLPGAQIELLLPHSACCWRLFEAGSSEPDQGLAAARSYLAGLQESVEPDDLDVSFQQVGDDWLVVGVPKPVLQAWIDVADMADVPLRRVEWSVLTALRTLQRSLAGDWADDLAWVIQASGQQGCRLVLVRDGVPEVDRLVRTTDGLSDVISTTASAWRRLDAQTSRPLAWLTCVADDSLFDVKPWLDAGICDRLLELPMGWVATPAIPEQETGSLDPFIHLAFAGLNEVQS